jgi:hypothetical protein
MSNATFETTRAYIQGQIQKFLPLIGGKSEITDKFLKAKVIALIEALEGINEYSNDLAAYGKHVSRLHRANLGAADGLHDVLVSMGVSHRHNGKHYPKKTN